MYRHRTALSFTVVVAVITVDLSHARAEDNAGLAKAVFDAIELGVKKGPGLYSDIVGLIDGHHKIIPWKRYENGPKFTVLPLINYKGGRMTDNFDHSPFDGVNRFVRFELVNVRPEHMSKIWWNVKSDVPGRGDGWRQANDKIECSHGSRVEVDKRAKKDYSFYLAGRWDRGVTEKEFFAANPNAAILMYLK